MMDVLKAFGGGNGGGVNELTDGRPPAFALPDPAAGRTELEIDRAAGKVRFWIGGQAYDLPPFEASDYHAAEAYLTSKRKDPFKAMEDQLEKMAHNPALQKQFLDRAWQDLRLQEEEDRIPDYQMKKWLDSEEGTVWQYWHALRKNYPGIGMEDVRRMLSAVGLAEARKRGRFAPDGGDRKAVHDRAKVGLDVANQGLVKAAGVGGVPGDADAKG